MKKRQQILTPRDIKSIHSVGLRSIPKVQRSSYLELYMLRREKDRLEKELLAVEKRKNSAERQLKSIGVRIRKLQKETAKEDNTKACRNVPMHSLKKMAISY